MTSGSTRSGGLAAPYAVVVSLLAIGCSGAGPVAGPTATAQSTIEASPSMTASPAPPTATATVPATPTRGPASTPSAAMCEPGDEDCHDVPPDGLLATGATEVAGWLGTYCYGNTCRDTMTIPKHELPQLTMAADGQLTFSLAGGTAFAGWIAGYSSGSNGPTTELARGGDLSDSGTGDRLTSATFPAPPPGDWALHVDLYFADGDAFYSWRVTIE